MCLCVSLGHAYLSKYDVFSVNKQFIVVDMPFLWRMCIFMTHVFDIGIDIELLKVCHVTRIA